MKKFFSFLPARLIVGVILGIIIGLFANENLMQVLVPIKNILGQLISFIVPIIVIGFIAPSITKLGLNATKMLGLALILAYASSVLAAICSMLSGYVIIPTLTIANVSEGLKELPKDIFALSIPQIMPVMSALVFAIIIGLSAAWTKSQTIIQLLNEFQKMVLDIVSKIVIPILPFFIACTFATLSYEGSITNQLPIFLIIILIVILGHYIWLFVLYGIAGLYSGKNPLEVIKNYGPAYLTAIGTMSSAATLAVSLKCAKKSSSDVLRGDMIDFGIPLFANIHLCGSVLTEVFFVMTISKVLYGQIPHLSTMLLFCILLAIFAIGAPGVPGGTVMASLGLISGILNFDASGIALMLTIFALQDSFGTACNVTGDGALTMILSSYANKHSI
ncbi:MAG: dicarboxylate/amino acid:cation symporter [Eubacteriales bacterium]|nr:dicarboxylate/amino acid:cation symporter [Eubacteriales bacterium]